MAGSTLASASVSPLAVGEPRKPVSLAQDIWRRFKRHRLALVGALILLVIVLGVAIGPWLWSVPINAIDFNARLAPPSWQHPFGTDDLGQDMLARMLTAGGSRSRSACRDVDRRRRRDRHRRHGRHVARHRSTRC